MSLITITSGLVGCSVTADKCLQTPISAKVHITAVDSCKQALKQNPDRQDLFYQYVGLLRVRGRYEEVVSWSRWVLDHDATRTDALYNLAYGLRKTGKCTLALEKYQSYALRNKQDADPFYGMALCYEDLNQPDQAKMAYTIYIQREQRRSQQAWIERAKSRLAALNNPQQKAPAASVTPVSPAAPMTPVAPAAPTPPVSPARPTTPVAPAAPTTPVAPATPPLTMTPSVAANPPVAVASPVAGDCSSHEGAIRKDPFNTSAYDKFAECAYQAGRYDQVVSRMRVALRDNPDFVRAWYHLGRALRAKGDETQAKRSLARACKQGVTEACH